MKPTYLYVAPYATEVVTKLRSDQNWYGWLADQGDTVQIFRWNEGRFERLRVVTEQVPSTKPRKYTVLRYIAEWREVEKNENG